MEIDRGYILEQSLRKFKAGQIIKGMLIAIWVLVPLKWAAARLEYVRRKKRN